MCDIDLNSNVDDCSDVGSDYESDMDSDSVFEGLDSVDDASYESFDEVSDISSDFDNASDSDVDLDSLDSVDDANLETIDIENENDYAESVDELEEFESLRDDEDFSQDSLMSGEVAVETDETVEDDSPMALTREITPEIIENRERYTEETLENYRDNLQEYGVAEEQIDEFIEQEREKINAEYESLDHGDTSSNIYYQPTDWEEVANSLSAGRNEQLNDENINSLVVEQSTEQTSVDFSQDSLMSGEVAVETDETVENDSPMALTREITPEIIENRERYTEETLENYRDNLQEYGVAEEQIDEFIEQEREKINAEYESLDHGDTSSNIYYQPTDWEEVANSLSAGRNEQLNDDDINSLAVKQSTERTNAELQELDINYDEIYEGIQQEALEESFADMNIDADPERLDNSLENFNMSTWENLTMDEQKGSMETLADYVVDVIGFKNPPQIEYYNNEQEGDFGGYDSSTNTLHINEYMLYNSDEAADTIAHELWHAHQYECAVNPQNPRDYQYQYNLENYIPPALGQEAYEAQLVEAEARAFAAQFKDRLSMIKGRSI